MYPTYTKTLSPPPYDGDMTLLIGENESNHPPSRWSSGRDAGILREHEHPDFTRH